jgi:hypothetical protein
MSRASQLQVQRRGFFSSLATCGGGPSHVPERDLIHSRCQRPPVKTCARNNLSICPRCLLRSLVRVRCRRTRADHQQTHRAVSELSKPLAAGGCEALACSRTLCSICCRERRRLARLDQKFARSVTPNERGSPRNDCQLASLKKLSRPVICTMFSSSKLRPHSVSS